MADNKYGEHVKTLSFADCGKGYYRHGVIMDKEFLGLDVHVQYGTFWTAGRIGEEPYVPHVNDFDQVMVFMGADTTELSDLGAEIELCLGEEMETFMITTATAVAVPKGLPHMPAKINRLDKRFIFIVISNTSKYEYELLETDNKPTPPVAARTSKYGKNVIPLQFRRKGAWYYGAENRDDAGGQITFVRTNDAGINFTMIYECIKKGPYRIGPKPDKPHAHANPQVMLFLGTDTDNLNDLGAEFEICLGKEEERHVFTNSTAVVTPPYLPHWPGGVTKLTRPIIMADIHPTGDSQVSSF